MNKYNLEELKEKLERCKNIPIEDNNIKLKDCINKVLKNLYK